MSGNVTHKGIAIIKHEGKKKANAFHFFPLKETLSYYFFLSISCTVTGKLSVADTLHRNNLMVKKSQT